MSETMDTDRPTLIEACRLENERLKDDPNVLWVGFGLRLRAGEVVEEACLTYSVITKHADEESLEGAGSQMIPREAHGYPTDVVEAHEVRTNQCPDDDDAPTGSRGGRAENPLIGGTSSTVLGEFHSFPTGYGTLGGLCFDAATGNEMVLSNAHVWGEDTGRDVIQPWMPIDEYLEAGVKLLLCGGLAFLFDLTLPSPTTVALSAAAAGAWIAAAASDVEDPVRWGQRTTGAPAGGALTEREIVRLSAEVPPMPLPGRPYTTKVTWDYTRVTADDQQNASITEERRNDHVLLGKRVWTDREEYPRGTRVRICAEVFDSHHRDPEDYLVVAHCFPKADPDDVYRRVLTPGACRPPRIRVREFYGFPPPAMPRENAPRRIQVSPFEIAPGDGTRFYGPVPSGDPNAVTALAIPERGLHCAFPSSSHVVAKVMHFNAPVKVEAFNSAGIKVREIVSSEDQGVVHELTLDALEIATLAITGGGAEGVLLGMEAHQNYDWEDDKLCRRLSYTGILDLGLELDPDEWGIVLFVQTVDNSPLDTDAIVAAQNVGGIVASANVAILGCAGVMLLDHAFDVI